jgi:hypothetical protein
VTGVLLVGLFGLIHVARGQGGEVPSDGPGVVRREADGHNVRQVAAPARVEAPSISFIDSPTPFCYQPDPGRDACYINWESLYVQGAPASMAAMTVTLDAIGPVARYQGYFQDTIFVSYDMHGGGFQVPCGAPGAGGRGRLGNGYDWTIQAEDSDGLVATNAGTIYCPPFGP